MNELFESSYLSIMSGKCEEYRKEIERLTAESTEWESKFYDLQEENKTKEKENIYLDSEIGRLNNIINELHKALNKEINNLQKAKVESKEYVKCRTLCDILNKLSDLIGELKESDNNE